MLFQECHLGMIYLKWWKRRTYYQEYSTQKDLFRFDREIKSFPDKQKVREFSTTKEFTANAKEISPSMKHKTRKRPTENKPQTIKEMVIRSHISIITLNANGLHTWTKRHRQAG